MSAPRRFGWRIATTEAGLASGYFSALGIQPPTNAPYHPYSTRVGQSTGGQARHGYKNVRMFWANLDRIEARILKERVVAGIALTGNVYLTIDRANGDGDTYDWIDVYGKPHIPDFDPSRFAGASDIVHENIELFVNNLTIVNDPASF